MAEIAPVYVFATLDTKFDEANFLANAIKGEGVPAVIVDVGTFKPPLSKGDVGRAIVAGFHPRGAAYVFEQNDRGAAIIAMGQAVREFMLDVHANGRCSGMIGLGGTGGSSMIASGMRGLPIGFPKLLVSTVASGDTSSYIGTSDIAMMPSIVDVAGLNRVSKRIYRDAAGAIAGMARMQGFEDESRPALGVTMFGVTTPCVTAVREVLEQRGFDTLVFHATGVGGRAMEGLAGSGLIEGILDITTTEVADEVVGGVFACGPDRFNVMLERKMPYLLSLGALDMVNFGPLDTVPAQFRDRKLHVHNSSVTLMRTSVEENVKCARWIAGKLNAYPDSPFTLLIPEGGVSELDKPGNPFHDPEADEALFKVLEETVVQRGDRKIMRCPAHINDQRFCDVIVEEFNRLR